MVMRLDCETETETDSLKESLSAPSSALPWALASDLRLEPASERPKATASGRPWALASELRLEPASERPSAPSWVLL